MRKLFHVTVVFQHYGLMSLKYNVPLEYQNKIPPIFTVASRHLPSRLKIRRTSQTFFHFQLPRGRPIIISDVKQVVAKEVNTRQRPK